MSNIGRNAPCPCGSGKKYKKCCLGEYQLTENDLYNHLKEEVQLFVFLCKSYDERLTHVAKILATRIGILIHDTKNSTSLLTQL
jgi:hypothetical protein